MGVFQATFWPSAHSRGTPVSREMPWPLGPRHCDHQGGSGVAAVAVRRKRERTVRPFVRNATPACRDVTRPAFLRPAADGEEVVLAADVEAARGHGGRGS